MNGRSADLSSCIPLSFRIDYVAVVIVIVTCKQQHTWSRSSRPVCRSLVSSRLVLSTHVFSPPTSTRDQMSSFFSRSISIFRPRGQRPRKRTIANPKTSPNSRPETDFGTFVGTFSHLTPTAGSARSRYRQVVQRIISIISARTSLPESGEYRHASKYRS